MVCIDTSSLIAYLEGSPGPDTDLVDRAFLDQVGVISPITVAELLSDPKITSEVRALVLGLPTLPILEGYWERAGLLRAKLLARAGGNKAKLADTLIAQTCLDHDASPVARHATSAPSRVWARCASCPETS